MRTLLYKQSHNKHLEVDDWSTVLTFGDNRGIFISYQSWSIYMHYLIIPSIDPVQMISSVKATHASTDIGWPGKRSLISDQWSQENICSTPSLVPQTTLLPFYTRKMLELKKWYVLRGKLRNRILKIHRKVYGLTVYQLFIWVKIKSGSGRTWQLACMKAKSFV